MPATWPNFRGSQLLPCTPLNPANFNWNPHKQATWGTGKVSWTLLRYWLTSPVLNLPLHLLPSTLGMLQGLDHTHYGTEECPKQAKALRCCEEGKTHQRQGALTGVTASSLQKIPGIWGKNELLFFFFKKKNLYDIRNKHRRKPNTILSHPEETYSSSKALTQLPFPDPG